MTVTLSQLEAADKACRQPDSVIRTLKEGSWIDLCACLQATRRGDHVEGFRARQRMYRKLKSIEWWETYG